MIDIPTNQALSQSITYLLAEKQESITNIAVKRTSKSQVTFTITIDDECMDIDAFYDDGDCAADHW